MPDKKVYLFTGYGLGKTTDQDLQLRLAKKFLGLLSQVKPLPAQICFYTDGVRLCVEGSPVLDELHQLEALGVELVLCSTCLETFGLTGMVNVGVIGGMGDILTSLAGADDVVTL